MSQARTSAVIVATILMLAACAPAASTPVSTGQPAQATSSTSLPTGTASALTGDWDGALTGDYGDSPVRLDLDGCGSVGSPCGEIEYLDAGPDDTVMCASELTLTAHDGDRFSFSERYVYRGWMCMPTTFVMTHASDGSLAVEQLIEQVACCRGTLNPRTASPDPTPEVPAAIAGLGQTTAATALGGATTQYAAAAAGSLWFPLEGAGAVVRVDAATGALSARIETGEPGALDGTDPHGVAAGDAGVWVALAAAKAVGRIDPATNAIADTVPVAVSPYALALDGNTLWVTSFVDDRVVRVDLVSKKVVADIPVSKPTGIAVGLGGVWVVRHRDDVLVRIDPATNKLTAEISLGERGPNELCGMCVENVVVSDGSVWTANNEARSVSRIDPATNKVAATIKLSLRPWAVTAGGGRIWASQFEGTPDGGFADPSKWSVASIDPATNEPTSTSFPGALSVTWGDDALWVVMPGRRGDVVVRVEPEAP